MTGMWQLDRESDEWKQKGKLGQIEILIKELPQENEPTKEILQMILSHLAYLTHNVG